MPASVNNVVIDLDEVEQVHHKTVALQEATKENQNDRAFVLAAVKKNGLALKAASKELRNDKEIALAAVSQTW